MSDETRQRLRRLATHMRVIASQLNGIDKDVAIKDADAIDEAVKLDEYTAMQAKQMAEVVLVETFYKNSLWEVLRIIWAVRYSRRFAKERRAHSISEGLRNG